MENRVELRQEDGANFREVLLRRMKEGQEGLEIRVKWQELPVESRALTIVSESGIMRKAYE